MSREEVITRIFCAMIANGETANPEQPEALENLTKIIEHRLKQHDQIQKALKPPPGTASSIPFRL